MGDKAAAREQAQKAGVPTVPGSDGVITDMDEADWDDVIDTNKGSATVDGGAGRQQRADVGEGLLRHFVGPGVAFTQHVPDVVGGLL